jgi:hypothetical protein
MFPLRGAHVGCEARSHIGDVASDGATSPVALQETEADGMGRVRF